MASSDNEPSIADGSTSRPYDGDERLNTQERVAMQERVAETARDAALGAKRQAEAVYDGASSAAAETSDAIGEAADALESSGHETLSQAAAALSDRVRTFSDYLQDRKLEDLIGDARRLAQRNPGLCIAGGVALGFALSHLLKAASHNPNRATRDVS